MFENVIAQEAALQLQSDIALKKLAPSMLFFGPLACGKGSCALELARVLSCEEGRAQWNCQCQSCMRHRFLTHEDLAMLGPRNFITEIIASKTAFLNDPSSMAGKILFIRSVRKLLGRFSQSVWEYEFRKSSGPSPLPMLSSLEEELDNFSYETNVKNNDMKKLEQISDVIVKNAVKLSDECISESIPIAQVRKASYWTRLSSMGRCKTLIIENADLMEEKARNALLKLLEEPPSHVKIILTAIRRDNIIPTVLSRLRPYKFSRRSVESEKEIVRRVFRASTYPHGGENKIGEKGLIEMYLESFLPHSEDVLKPLAAFFVAAVARQVSVFAKRKGMAEIPHALSVLGSYSSKIAEAEGYDRVSCTEEAVTIMLKKSKDFEGKSFTRFLSLSLEIVASSFKENVFTVEFIPCMNIWKKQISQTQTFYRVFNLRPQAALESLFARLKDDLKEGLKESHAGGGRG